MFNYGVVVLCLLGVAVGSPFSHDEQDYNHYHGPPAPLNLDGTVAFTPEYEHIRDEHSALFDLEYNRIKNNVDAADPYSIKYHSYAHDSENEGQYLPEHDTYEDEGLYKPELYEKKYSRQYDDGQYRPHLYEQEEQDEEQFNYPPSTQDTSYRPTYAPAPLNPDGTVAHTPEYNAIASSFLTPHSRHRRSAELYQGPPAPLNHDMTVDYTPEVKHVNDAHFTAVANQFKRLQATAALAAAYPDRTSPPSKDYNPQNNGQNNLLAPYLLQGQQHGRRKRSYTGEYLPQQHNARHYDDGQYRPHLYKHDDGQYRPHLHKHDSGQYKPHLHQVVDYNTVPFQPAPLNNDGTVAHVPEYQAIAATHLAAHHRALSSVTH